MEIQHGIGDEVSISYISERSGNIVNRKGVIKQIPNDGKDVLFIETDENQLTAVKNDHVYSVTVNRNAIHGEAVERNTYLGDLKTIE